MKGLGKVASTSPSLCSQYVRLSGTGALLAWVVFLPWLEEEGKARGPVLAASEHRRERLSKSFAGDDALAQRQIDSDAL